MIDFNKKRRVGAGQAALENTAELKKLKKLKSRGTPRLLSSGLAPGVSQALQPDPC